MIFQVPKEWTVVCWLTETITSSLMQERAEKSINFAISVFEKLMNAIMTYYVKANAPGLLKSVTLRLIARLVVKIRYLYRQIEQTGAVMPEALASKTHLERMFISRDFLSTLVSEAKTYMQIEEEDILNQNKARLLYPAIVQDAAELLMNIAVPVQKSLAFSTSSELLPADIELPSWSEPLLNVSHFLHFFRGETRLPQKLLDEVCSSTQKKHF